MTTLNGWFKLDKLSFVLAGSTLFITALTRLLPFEWMETASQWGVLALLIAFILGCATLFVMSIASMLPREQTAHKINEARVRRTQVVPVYALTASVKLKK